MTYHSNNTQPTRKGGFLGDFTVKKYKVIQADKLPERYKIKNGDIGVFTRSYHDVEGAVYLKNSNWYLDGEWCFHPSWVELIPEGMPNREFLADFIKLNNIKKTLVSKYLGMAENWLTTMVNEKRATRKDISDATLQDIMRKLHIDWTSQEFINVKATKLNTAYKTKPCNYSRVVDKERLQKAMWAGNFIKA